MPFAQVFLAAIFAVAGVAKLADRVGTRKAVVEFGVAERLAGPLALLLPVAELTVAGLLLPAPTIVVGAVGALVLLALFTAAIGVSLARGRTPNCHCFGQIHSAPASWKTLVRNGALTALAVFVLVESLGHPGESVLAWVWGLGRPQLLVLLVGIVAAVLLAAGTSAFLTLMRSYGQVLLRLEQVEASLARAGISLVQDTEWPEIGLDPGTPAPAFTASDLTGDVVSLERLLAPGAPVMLLFASPGCGPCKALAPQVAEWQRVHADELAIAMASDGGLEDVRAIAKEFGIRHVLLDPDHRLYRLFQANGTPSAVLIRADGTMGSRVATGQDRIEHLLNRVLDRSDEARLIPVGSQAPGLELQSLDGATVTLAIFRGHDTVLLFWNPSCGFCRAMHDDLLAWERSTNGKSRHLAVISSGDAESARSEGFRFPVLLDPRSAVSAAFGANGTPMAVRLDGEGRVASAVVAGAEAVLSLVSGRA